MGAYIRLMALLAVTGVVLVSSAETRASPGDTVADRVFGQGGSFQSGQCQLGGVSASSLCYPRAVPVDTVASLYVVDEADNRVLEYDSPLTTDTVADRVFGQGGSFTSNTCNLGGRSASSLCAPAGLGVDGSGNLYVADLLNHRVLEYDSPLTTDTVADRVFGQGGSFTTGSCNQGAGSGSPSATSLCYPRWVAAQGASAIYVADDDNSRVVEYDDPLNSDTTADRVFGQGGSFTTGACNQGAGFGNPTAATLCNPEGVTVDGTGNLYVGDTLNHRVLEYDAPLSTPVGGIAELPDVASTSLHTGGSSSPGVGLLAGIAAAFAVGAVALAGAWYARRQRLR